MIRRVLESQFIRFSLVGAIGFVLDAGALTLLAMLPDANLYVARLVSYLFAATGTWLLNRRYTFEVSNTIRLHRQWSAYVILNALGGALNYVAYAVSLFMLDTVRSWPVLGVAIGSAVGLVVNYSINKKFVFRAD